MNDCPVATPLAGWERNSRNGREKISRPKIASTMLGTPAIISIADSSARASQDGRPYSDSQVASAMPSGAAMPMPIAVTISVPMIGSRKPPDWLWLSDGAGCSTNRRGRR